MAGYRSNFARMAAGIWPRWGLPCGARTRDRGRCRGLRSQSLTDREVATALGLTRLRSVDRLLGRHAALDAQRAVKELLAR